MITIPIWILCLIIASLGSGVFIMVIAYTSVSARYSQCCRSRHRLVNHNRQLSEQVAIWQSKINTEYVKGLQKKGMM